MNNVQSGSLNAPRTAITGSQDNFYESCPSQAARLALPGAPCAAALDALKQFSAGLATAECRVVGLAMRSQPAVISPDCCPALRQFVSNGCACDTATRFVSPAANARIIDLVAAARVAQVSICATDEYGGAIANPCRNIVSCEVNALQGQNMPTPAPSSLLSSGTSGKPPPAKAPAPPAPPAADLSAPGYEGAEARGAAGAAAAAAASAAAQPRPVGAAAVPNAAGGPPLVVPDRVGILGHPMERAEGAAAAAAGGGGGAKAAAGAAAAAVPPAVPAAPAAAAAAATNAAAPRADPAPAVAPAAAAAAAAAAVTAAPVVPAAAADTAAPAAQKPPAPAAAATTAPPQQPVPPQGSGMLRQVLKQQQRPQQRERPERPERPQGPPHRRGGAGADGVDAPLAGVGNRRMLLQVRGDEPAPALVEDPAALFAEDESDGSRIALKPEEAAAIQASADATAAVLAGATGPTTPPQPPQRPQPPPGRLAKMTDPDPTPPPTKQAAAAAAAAAGTTSVPVAAVVAEGGIAASTPGKLSRVTDAAAAAAVVPQPGKLSRMSDPTPTPRAVSAAAPSAAAAAKKGAAPAPAPARAAVPTQAGWLGAVPLPPKPAPTPKPVAVVAGGSVVAAKPGTAPATAAVAKAPAAAKKEVPIDWKWGPHPAKWFASWPRVKKNGEMQKFIKTPGVGNLPDPNPYYVPTAKEQAIIDKKAAKTPA